MDARPGRCAMKCTRRLGLVILCLASASCGGGDSGCGPNPQFGLLCCPTCPAFVPKTCSELRASQFHWILSGFTPSDILNPDMRNQPELTAIMHVGVARSLRVAAGTTDTSEDCSSKATQVDWAVSNPAVARLEIQPGSRAASLVAVEPGDTNVSATLQFDDGTPSLHVLPWSFTNVGSGDVSVIRVVP
jgi:hypothetical protein